MLPQQQRQKGIKIDSKFLRKKKLNCENCQNFKAIETEYSDNVGWCYAFLPEGQSARGARNEDKWCGMRGKKFVPKQEEPKLIEQMTLQELNEIDTNGLQPNDKRRITNAKKKLIGE